MCLSYICLLAMLICVTFSLPPGVRGWLRLLLVALSGFFCLPFCIISIDYVFQQKSYPFCLVSDDVTKSVEVRHRKVCKLLGINSAWSIYISEYRQFLIKKVNRKFLIKF